MKEYFKDRQDAAWQLSAKLQKYKEKEGIVLAVPRGAVPLAYVIAQALDLPLGLLLVKKIAHPDNDEYAIGAVSLENLVINEGINDSEGYITSEARRIRDLLKKKYNKYIERQPHDFTGKTVIVVDDGIATGQTMLAGIELLRRQNPERLIVAVPVGGMEALDKVSEMADEVVCLHAQEGPFAIGQFYQNFEPVDDEVVSALLDKAAGWWPGRKSEHASRSREKH